MALIRILLIALVIWLLLRLFKNWSAKKALERKRQQPAELKTIVKCAHCGLHVPKNEAIESANRYYCSQAHKKLHQDDPG